MSVIHAHYATDGFLNQDDDTRKAMDELLKEWGDILNIIAGIVYCCYTLKADQKEKTFALEEVYGENFEELERIDTISILSDDPYTRKDNTLIDCNHPRKMPHYE
ncbi:hypothetical protein FCM35_KLT17027 [Carex littledalei]|uniref:Uncharacterized protein n=1 Tax=Carex littledalei TaxID=544730 RepID=A0A833VR27_9POAL|nr:hypothetical protein FCM35_KLT17027 [Carex littledalei]